jgi:hypothetical protein
MTAEEFSTTQQPFPTPPPPNAIPGKNGLAIASLVLGLLGCLSVTSLVGLVLGIVALVQIKRTGQAGKGLAIGGIVASCVWLVVGALLLFNELYQPTKIPTVFQLDKGGCYTETGSTGENAPRVSCTSPHDGEVFATFVDAGETYPGQPQLESRAQAGCLTQVRYLYGTEMPAGLVIKTYYPSERAWGLRMRTTVCAVQKRSGQLTEPVVPR